MGVDISQKTLICAAKVREWIQNTDLISAVADSLPRDHKSIYLFLHTLQMRQCPIPFQHCSQAHVILPEHMLHCWFFTNGTPIRLGQSNSICKSRIKWLANIVAFTKNAGTAEDPDNTEAWSQLSIGNLAKTLSLWGFYNRYGPTAPCSWHGHLHWGMSVSIHCISILHSRLEVTEADALVYSTLWQMQVSECSRIEGCNFETLPTASGHNKSSRISTLQHGSLSLCVNSKSRNLFSLILICNFYGTLNVAGDGAFRPRGSRKSRESVLGCLVPWNMDSHNSQHGA
jgi:hypothetical protein